MQFQNALYVNLTVLSATSRSRAMCLLLKPLATHGSMFLLARGEFAQCGGVCGWRG